MIPFITKPYVAYVTNEDLIGQFVVIINGTQEKAQLGGFKTDRSLSVCGLKGYSLRHFDYKLVFYDQYMRRLQLPKVSSLNMRYV